jgi:hypothetical protein
MKIGDKIMCVKDVINDVSGVIYEANIIYLIDNIKEHFIMSDEPVIYYYILRNVESNDDYTTTRFKHGYWMHDNYEYDKNNYIFSYFKTLGEYREDRINKILE